MAHCINFVGMLTAILALKISSYFETVEEPLYTEEQIKMFGSKFQENYNIYKQLDQFKSPPIMT